MEKTTSAASQEVKLILADEINEPLDAMRSDMDKDKLDDLAESIRSHGLINPITLCPVGDKYEIIAGHRRFKACLIAGVVRIPAVIRNMQRGEMLALRAHENLFRDDVNPVDEAMYVGKLVGEDETKIPEIAKSLNRSIQWVEDRLGILKYPDYFLVPLKFGQISLGVAKCLADIDDEYYRKMFFDQAVRDGMKVWQAEYYVSQYKAGVFKAGSEIIPPEARADGGAVATVRQMCAKCGQVAESPNLTNVFVHVTCPDTSSRP